MSRKCLNQARSSGISHAVSTDMDSVFICIKMFYKSSIHPQISSLSIIDNADILQWNKRGERVIIFCQAKMPCRLVRMKWNRSPLFIHFIIMGHKYAWFWIDIYIFSGTGQWLSFISSASMQPAWNRESVRCVKVIWNTYQEQAGNSVFYRIFHQRKVFPGVTMILSAICPHHKSKICIKSGERWWEAQL